MAMTAKPVTGTTIVVRVPSLDGELFQRVTTHTHASGSTVITETFQYYGAPANVEVTHTP